MLNLAGFKAAIIARVQSDQFSGGLWAAQRLINAITYTYEGRDAMSGIKTAMPYVAFDVPSAEQVDGFTHDLQEIYFRFHVWYHFTRNKDAAITAAGTICDRLYGNALAVSTRIPTYGFHRHKLVLTITGDTATPWTAGVCYRTGSNEAHENDALHFIETYRVNMARVVAAS